MKKLLLLLLPLFFVSCSNYRYNNRTYEIEDFINFDTLAETPTDTVAVDKNTDCLYYIKGYKMSPIMKPDGTVLTLKEFQERINK